MNSRVRLRARLWPPRRADEFAQRVEPRQQRETQRPTRSTPRAQTTPSSTPPNRGRIDLSRAGPNGLARVRTDLLKNYCWGTTAGTTAGSTAIQFAGAGGSARRDTDTWSGTSPDGRRDNRDCCDRRMTARTRRTSLVTEEGREP